MHRRETPVERGIDSETKRTERDTCTEKERQLERETWRVTDTKDRDPSSSRGRESYREGERDMHRKRQRAGDAQRETWRCPEK